MTLLRVATVLVIFNMILVGLWVWQSVDARTTLKQEVAAVKTEVHQRCVGENKSNDVLRQVLVQAEGPNPTPQVVEYFNGLLKLIPPPARCS